MPFSYPALPTGADAIRILELQPGDFADPLVGELRSVAFRDKPKYVALSYTWGSSYPWNADLKLSPSYAEWWAETASKTAAVSEPPLPKRKEKGKSARPDSLSGSDLPRGSSPSPSTTSSTSHTIILNGEPFGTGHNLCLALLHLRSLKCAIPFWIDAICINQLDEHERNKQVSLMAFIYTRAVTVVAWLGTKIYHNPQTCFITMHEEWETGSTRHLGKSFARGRYKYNSDPEPDFFRVMQSAYWTRMWIVQEMCLPRMLLLAYGAKIWEFDHFRRHQLDATPFGHKGSKSAVRLLQTRDQRHNDMMKFENLIERFSESQCTNIRDKIYGLVGCANDIRPFTGQDERADALKAHIDCLTSGKTPKSPLSRGAGAIKVDYSRSMYDIWIDVVGFAYFQAHKFEKPVGLPHIHFEDIGADGVPRERAMSVVRTAGMIQCILDQRLEAETPLSTQATAEQEHPFITAVGYLAGTIVHIGPDYTSLVGSSSASLDWNDSWIDHFYAEKDLKTIRITNELYTAKILGYEDNQLASICAIANPHVTAWERKPMGPDACVSHPDHARTYREIHEHIRADDRVPRICLMSARTLGLVPSNARVGDVIIRFYKCNAALVMRPIETNGEVVFYMLVGRADVSGLLDACRDSKGSTAGSRLLKTAYKSYGTEGPKEINVELNLRTLQRITANIIAFAK